MKIFFIATIQQNDKLGNYYKSIIDQIKKLDHNVTSDYLLELSQSGLEDMEDSGKLFDFHKKVIKGIKNADLVIAEVSTQRTSMGYWLSLALEYGKPTIALFKKGNKSLFLETLENNEKFITFEYSSIEDIEKELKMLIDFASDQQDTRFNFFIAPKHQNYLDWIAKYKKLPRSVYLRRLMEDDMQNNEEYQKSAM